MKVVRTIEDYRKLNLSNVGFVPTMGALHTGHISLLELVRRCDNCVLSIFVNPTQFGPNEDFSKYPRTLDSDLAVAEESGVDVVFMPDVEEMYAGNDTSIRIGRLAEVYEGAIRPNHFSGVATIVSKLFNIITPSVSAFGRKDLQQCAVIQQTVRDLNFKTELAFGETIREDTGLAMSSRNRYLSAEDRLLAATIYRTMQFLRDEIRSGRPVETCLEEGKENLVRQSFSIDYLDLITFPTFEPLTSVVGDAYLIVAVRLNGVRLIDNLQV